MSFCYGDAENVMAGIQKFFRKVIKEWERVEYRRGVDQVYVFPHYTRDRRPGEFYGKLNAFFKGEGMVGEFED